MARKFRARPHHDHITTTWMSEARQRTRVSKAVIITVVEYPHDFGHTTGFAFVLASAAIKIAGTHFRQFIGLALLAQPALSVLLPAGLPPFYLEPFLHGSQCP
ncbi:hypothetical protein [Endozoicomonas sp. ONNA2]|uniref:hypothetical protein n=1 Tax=Endozoicomonas sp. ONNA2 TaxID=2828741 RepID=UPI002148719D|nr:hypothetical protein [Endozoicomonas sp. ONNA2]